MGQRSMSTHPDPIDSLNTWRHNRALVDYYLGPDGLSLLMDVLTEAQLDAFLRLFRSLADGSIESVALHFEPSVAVTGVREVWLHSSASDADASGKQIVVRDGMFLWTKSHDGWRSIVERIEGYRATESSWMHYLSDTITDEAEIELSYRQSHRYRRE